MKFSDRGNQEDIVFNDGTSQHIFFDELRHPKEFSDSHGHHLKRIGNSDKWRSAKGELCTNVEIDPGSDLMYTDSATGIKHTVMWSGTERQEYSEIKSGDFRKLFAENLLRLDKNHDGIVSKNEVNTALADTRNKGYRAELVLGLRENFDQLLSLRADKNDKSPGLKQSDIDQFERLSKIRDSRATAIKASIELNGYGFGHGTDHKAFGEATRKYSLDPNGCNQGQIGDCVVVSAESAIARVNPQTIEKMIKENPDGSFTVTFPSQPKQPRKITISPAEEVYYGAAGDRGLWPAIITKAYGTLKMDECKKEKPLDLKEMPVWLELLLPGLRKNLETQAATNCPADFLQGNSMEHALRSMTGKPVGTMWPRYVKPEDLERKLVEIVHEKNPALAGTNPITLDFGNSNVVGQHDYSVVGFDAKEKIVTLRNPWGIAQSENESDKQAAAYGEFKIPLKEFRDNYLWLTYTTDKPEWGLEDTVKAAQVAATVIDALMDNTNHKDKKTAGQKK